MFGLTIPTQIICTIEKGNLRIRGSSQSKGGLIILHFLASSGLVMGNLLNAKFILLVSSFKVS